MVRLVNLEWRLKEEMLICENCFTPEYQIKFDLFDPARCGVCKQPGFFFSFSERWDLGRRIIELLAYEVGIYYAMNRQLSKNRLATTKKSLEVQKETLVGLISRLDCFLYSLDLSDEQLCFIFLDYIPEFAQMGDVVSSLSSRMKHSGVSYEN